jgi:hypothetical protein
LKWGEDMSVEDVKADLIKLIEKNVENRKYNYRPDEVAKLFCVHKNTVSNWAKCGKINTIGVNGQSLRRVYYKELIRFINEELCDAEESA